MTRPSSMRSRGARLVPVVLAAVALQFAAASGAAGAENGLFGVAPHPARVDGKERRVLHVPSRGPAQIRDAVRIYSRSDRVLKLSVYAAPARVQDDGLVAIGFNDGKRTGLAAGIRLGTNVVTLRPGAGVVVPFEVRVPDGPAAAGDLAAVVVEPLPEASSKPVEVVQRIAVLVRPGSVLAAPATRPASGRPWAWLALLAVPLVAFAARHRRSRRRRLEGAGRPKPLTRTVRQDERQQPVPARARLEPVLPAAAPWSPDPSEPVPDAGPTATAGPAAGRLEPVPAAAAPAAGREMVTAGRRKTEGTPTARRAAARTAPAAAGTSKQAAGSKAPAPRRGTGQSDPRSGQGRPQATPPGAGAGRKRPSSPRTRKLNYIPLEP